MNGKNKGSVKARRSRTIKVAPVTRAVRMALAASVTALALGASGAAFAAKPVQQAPQTQTLQLELASIDFAPVFDLTAVPQGLIGPQSVNTLLGPSDPPAGPVTTGYSQHSTIDNGTTTFLGPVNFSVISGEGEDVHAMDFINYGGSKYVHTDNGGTISATSTGGEAVGIYVRSDAPSTYFPSLLTGVSNTAAITANGYTDAAGIAVFGVGDVAVTNGGAITADAYIGNAYGILASSTDGDVTVTNNLGGDIEAYSAYGSAYGIFAVADAGLVTINNAAAISASIGEDGNAIGIFGYSGAGDVSIDNSGEIQAAAESKYGIADGIFASGANVGVTNSGAIDVTGGSWASGIEAQGDTSVTVTNTASIYSTANDFVQVYVDGSGTVVNEPGGQAFGLYATGGTGGAVVGNEGDLHVYGGDATGVLAQSMGDTTVTNSGTIHAGNGLDAFYGDGYAIYYGTGNATGIYAGSNGEGAVVSVENDGTIYASGTFSANGIVATASGTGGIANVTNAASLIYARADYGNTYGIVASADGDASVDTDGVIASISGASGIGVAALSFNGEASVTNAGSVYAFSTLNSANVEAVGLLAFTANGSASVDNSGYVYAHGVKNSTGIDVGAGASGDVTVTNSGDIVVESSIVSGSRANGIRATAGGGDIEVENGGTIYASGAILAFGVYSSNGTGDTHISNATDGDIEFYSYAGRGFGAFAFAEQGDVSFENAGDIHGYAWQQAYGARIRDLYGDASASNSGTIDVESGNNKAFGLLAVSQYAGTASITNSGDIGVAARTAAYGVRAYGAESASVGNSGSIYAKGGTVAVGMMVASGGDVAVTNTGGSIEAIAGNVALGIRATAAGSLTVTNASEITAVGYNGFAMGIYGYALGDVDIGNSADVYVGSFGDAIGIYGYSVYGDATIDNTGQVVAHSIYGLADGIFASGQDVMVTNSGYVVADATVGEWAAGIEAQGSNSVQVANSGDIVSQAMSWVQVQDYYGNSLYYSAGGQAFGIYATGGAGGALVNNSGDIMVDAGYATGIEVQSAGDLSIVNSGDIMAGSGLSYYSPEYNVYVYQGTQVATGINAVSNGEGAHVVVGNTGNIYADGVFGATGIAATSGGTGGMAGVDNDGNVYVAQNQKYGYGAYGIVTSADGDSFIDNSGTIGVYSGGGAFGLAALSFAGDAGVVNSGDINVENTAQAKYGSTGILAFAANGTAYVDNSGSVDVYTPAVLYASARAVDAQGQQGVLVKNSGSLYASGKYAYGVYALSSGGDVNVINEANGDIGFYSYLGNGFGVLGISYTGDVTVINNGGSIGGYAYGQSVGVFAVAVEGDAGVGNYGSIDVASGDSAAVGVFARADGGTATVVNTGDITASDFPGGAYTGDVAYGILARGAYAQVSNSGSVLADGYYAATGIAARSDDGTTVTTTAASDIEVLAQYVAIGIEGRSEYGDVAVSNAGGITTAGGYGSVGIQAYSDEGNAAVVNTGHVVADSAYGMAIGVTSYSVAGNAVASNNGSIEATGIYGAYGIAAQSYLGDVTVANVSNGVIHAAAPSYAYGIVAQAFYGDVTINNAGDVSATADAGGMAAAVLMRSEYGTSTLNNAATGMLSVEGDLGYAFAVLGSYGTEVINNAGDIIGSVYLYGGDDTVNNLAGGLLDLTGHVLDTGDGDDTINNAAGGTILLENAAIYMGSSINGNAFNNTGKIKVNGDSLIDMGGSYSGEGGPVFAPTSIATLTPSLVPSLNPLPLVNNGVIDMGDGLADDSLTIIGDLGGKGALNIDVDVPSNTADHLIVDGSMAAGAVQTVNATFNPSLLAAAQSGEMTDFAWVTGNSTAGSFVGGQVTGFSASNFLSLGVVVTSSISANNSTDDVFSIGVDVNGLNDAGTLAANAASGAAGMLNAQIGTFRQRMGVNPYGDAGKVMSAFFRTYTSEGDANPTHAANFGNAGNFAYDQSTWGREVGVNANLFGNFHAGLVLGTADGRQRLTGDGAGTSRMDGMTFGAYATWFAPQGFYVDVSGRWMAVDIVSTSAGGQQANRAHTGAWNLEAGYDWKVGGLSIVPQLQYTRTKVDGITAVHGDMATFQGHGGVSERGRLGVEINKQFQTMNGVRWMPYASINAIREFDGEMAYTVADVFTGSTSTKGTSTMAELGVGVQKGNWGVTVGAHWTDGGAFKSTVGGQAIVRFAW